MRTPSGMAGAAADQTTPPEQATEGETTEEEPVEELEIEVIDEAAGSEEGAASEEGGESEEESVAQDTGEVDEPVVIEAEPPVDDTAEDDAGEQE